MFRWGRQDVPCYNVSPVRVALVWMAGAAHLSSMQHEPSEQATEIAEMEVLCFSRPGMLSLNVSIHSSLQ